jgi:hypothetical protein
MPPVLAKWFSYKRLFCNDLRHDRFFYDLLNSKLRVLRMSNWQLNVMKLSVASQSGRDGNITFCRVP